jgi:hypothetical protein
MGQWLSVSVPKAFPEVVFPAIWQRGQLGGTAQELSVGIISWTP